MWDYICQFWKLMVLFALIFAVNKRTAFKMIKVEGIQKLWKHKQATLRV
jgi:hypothetical protein